MKLTSVLMADGGRSLDGGQAQAEWSFNCPNKQTDVFKSGMTKNYKQYI